MSDTIKTYRVTWDIEVDGTSPRELFRVMAEGYLKARGVLDAVRE
jgi:hypothetical protein